LPQTMTQTSRKKAYVETYGCQMNISDGELMQGILAAQGYDIVARPEEADVVLVNTCAIREHAEQRVIGRVGELYRIKRDRPDMVIGVTGCMAQRLGDKLIDSAPYVDLVMGPDGYRHLPAVLGELLNGGQAQAQAQAHAESPALAPAPAHARRLLPVIQRAWRLGFLAPIARGCTRGRHSARTLHVAAPERLRAVARRCNGGRADRFQAVASAIAVGARSYPQADAAPLHRRRVSGQGAA